MENFTIPRLPNVETGKCCHVCTYFHRQGIQSSFCGKTKLGVTAGQCCDDFVEEITSVEKAARTKNFNDNILKHVPSIMYENKVVLTLEVKDFIKNTKNRYAKEYFEQHLGKRGDLFIWADNNRFLYATVHYITENDIDVLTHNDDMLSMYRWDAQKVLSKMLYEKYQ